MPAVFMERGFFKHGFGEMVRSETVGGKDSVGRTRERGGRGEREVNIQDAGRSMWLPAAVLGPHPPRVVSKAGGHYPLPAQRTGCC